MKDSHILRLMTGFKALGFSMPFFATSMETNINHLPKNILVQISTFLTAEEIRNAAQMSKKFNQLFARKTWLINSSKVLYFDLSKDNENLESALGQLSRLRKETEENYFARLELNLASNTKIKEVINLLDKHKNSITSIDLYLHEIFDGYNKVQTSLPKMFQKNIPINSICLRSNKITNKDVKIFAKMLHKNSTVTSIDLRFNNISNEQTKPLAEMLKKNSTITSIDLSFNNISNKGAKILAEMLKINKTITSINLCGNQIINEGIKALVETLKTNKTLTSINLSKNNMFNEGAKALLHILKTNIMINLIGLYENNIPTEIRLEIEDLYKKR